MKSTISEPVAVANVHDTLKDIDERLQMMLGPDVVVDQQLDAPLAHVRLRPSQLEQIVMELAIEARHAMPDGGRFRIRTSMDPWSNPNGSGRAGDLVIEVSDNGVGIPCQAQGQIFEGSCLGLSAVCGILRDAGGTISVSSAPGHGATFKIRLPLA
jgi:two-component system, cell cycle sensor histidine kinase and response regulator CckA